MLRPNDSASAMTVREDLAKAAMIGLVAGGTQTPELIAEKAYKIADAMIARANGATATPSRLPEERP
jgi:hypothetical protein